MKKTNSMRVAVAMLALTLITSCFVGGTFAKYTTSASGGDTARVTKFGVEIEAGKSAFLDKYKTDDGNANFEGEYSVQSADGKKVIAPGTSGEIDLFSISGTPEVAVRIDVKMDEVESIMIKPIISFNKVTVEEWEIGGSFGIGVGTGTVTDETESEKTEETIDATDLSVRPKDREWEEDYGDGWDSDVHKFSEIYESNLGDAYYPIKWTLIKDGAAVEGATDVTLTAVKNYINENINGTECKPNFNLATISGTYKLQWKWDYESDNNKVAYDAYDTNLGNIAAGKYGIYLSKEENENLENKEYNLTEAFKFSVTVTQIN